MALSWVWQVIDASIREIDMKSVGNLSDEEVQFVCKLMDAKAQSAFNEFDNLKSKLAKES